MLRRVVVHPDPPRSLFPAAPFAADAGGLPVVRIDADEWSAPDADLLAFDHRVHEAEDRGPFALQISSGIATQALLRYQRLAPARNVESATDLFAAVLERHGARHDRTRPLVRADHEHALDAWQWALRLEPDAPAATQMAALLHDIERLESEAEQRIEHRAADYQAFKDAHARRGADLAEALLLDAGAPRELAADVARLVARHERRADDPAFRLLNDADALSFFSLNSPGFVRYYGEDHTAKKVAYTLARMSPRARAWLPALRLDARVARLIDSCGRPAE